MEDMTQLRWDPKLLKKLAVKIGKSEKYTREQISKRAGKLGISSKAFLVLWAKKEGIGAAVYQRKLPSNIQAEIKDTLPSFFMIKARVPATRKMKIEKEKIRPKMKSSLSLAIEYLIQDEELYDRCEDLIKARRNFDRVLREATTVLEDRIRKLSGIKGMRPIDLVGKVLNPDPAKAVLKISNEKSEQGGFFNICQGLMLSFRDPTHHQLSDKFTREDALKFCGFIDSLLSVLGQTLKQNGDENQTK
ncbi:hypothetical protein COT64_02495 [Candidatus Shapirobacteria bacterium CG09_land_8_20_14_0_10_39_12]|uniref:Conserved hypothetical protein CHP02391 domain-containing protein n=1 Tax=Candidatus Shapirobacteria bacterium CG09_land_8_20_14_0_10_39_12 TaxID=1974885 RepID=A0A2H0WPA7_9BACT|nr:MAG: hypothetical protein COT64_02495 [Candidatus Shapirobacteria bacterium CG09_land_8_20_14_0_10_39_12]